MTYTKTSHGDEKLAYQGYMFNKQRWTGEGTEWCCDHTGCDSLILIGDDGFTVKRGPTLHLDHLPDYERIKERRRLESMKPLDPNIDGMKIIHKRKNVDDEECFYLAIIFSLYSN